MTDERWKQIQEWVDSTPRKGGRDPLVMMRMVFDLYDELVATKKALNDERENGDSDCSLAFWAGYDSARE